jgi:hypothetical protein
MPRACERRADRDSDFRSRPQDLGCSQRRTHAYKRLASVLHIRSKSWCDIYRPRNIVIDLNAPLGASAMLTANLCHIVPLALSAPLLQSLEVPKHA